VRHTIFEKFCSAGLDGDDALLLQTAKEFDETKRVALHPLGLLYQLLVGLRSEYVGRDLRRCRRADRDRGGRCRRSRARGTDLGSDRRIAGWGLGIAGQANTNADIAQLARRALTGA
jgi:hypothetical protein